MLDETGASRGFGFVHFESAESSEAAIAKVNGMLLNDKKVFVGHHISRRERHSKYEELKKNFTNVFVKNLDVSVTDEDLKKEFSKHGVIASIAIMKDENGHSRGFGFINFSTHEGAINACDELNESEFKGKKLYVGRAQKKSERKEELQRKYELLKQERLNKYQGVNLFVKNLDDTIDDEKFRSEFSAFGTITSSKVQLDDKGISRGFGFVCYSSPEEATKAVTEMNGRMLGSKPIYVGLAQRREVRRQQLEAQYAHRAQLRMAQQAGVLGGMGAMFGQPIFYNPMMPPRQPYGYPQMYPRPPRWQGAQGQPDMMASGYSPNGAPGRAPRTQGPPSRGPRPGAAQPAQRGVPPTGVPPMGGAPQSRSKGYRYTSNARNRVDPAGAPAAQQPAQAPMPGFQEPLTASILADASPDQQKQLLGERLFPLIYGKEPEHAPKITGMLLDMDNSELLHLLEAPDALFAKVEEAMAVLREHEQGGQ